MIETLPNASESSEAKRKKKLSKIRMAIMRFMAAGLILSAYPVGKEIAEHDQRKAEIEEPAGEIRSEYGFSGSEVMFAEEFDKVFSFEYQELERWQQKEEGLEEVFGFASPSYAQDFRVRLDAAKSSMDGTQGISTAKLKISFEEIFYPKKIGEDRKVNLSAIETGDGNVDVDHLESLIAGFPRNWIHGEIEAIIQSSKEGGIYEIDGIEWTTVANFQRRDTKINLFARTLKDSADHVVDILAHEAGHANDWFSDSTTSYEEKLELLANVAKRIEDPDRFQFVYAESKTKKTRDQKFNRYLHAQEYWADICAQYFKDPTRLPMEDFELVDGWVRKGDPDYDPLVFSEKRVETLNVISQGKISSQF